MTITITGHGLNVPVAVRAYAEYRVFARLARFSALLREVRIALHPDTAPGTSDVRCVVSVDAGRAGWMTAEASATHASGAIDRAADRTAWLLKRQGSERLSS